MSTHRTTPTPKSPLASFVGKYGWRAYALPVLVVLTVLALVQGVGHAASHDNAPKASTKVEGLAGKASNYRAAETPAPIVVNLGTDISSCGQNTYPQLLLVSISQQHLWACEGAKQVNSTAVTTGSLANNMQTPLGSWRVQGKQQDRYLVGPGYRDYVHYWVPFNGDFGLHDAPWQTMPFGSPNWRTQGSHGCVHVPTPTMQWVYNWATVNGTVVTIES